MASALQNMRNSYARELKIAQKENRHIVVLNMRAMNRREGIRTGDYIRAKNGSMHRVAYIWRDENDKPILWQTASGAGSYALGKGYISYSGGLNKGFLEGTKFRKLNYLRNGNVWIFKDNFAMADNSVAYSNVKFRVFEANTNIKF